MLPPHLPSPGNSVAQSSSLKIAQLASHSVAAKVKWGQVKCTVPPSPLLWKNQDDFFETFDDRQTEVKALVGDVDQLVQRRASRAVDVLLTQVPDCPLPARDHSPVVSFQCRLNKQKRHWEPYPWFFQTNFFDQDQLDPNT